MHFCRYGWAGVFALSLVVGCGNDKGDVSAERLKKMAGGELKKVVPVSGKVTVDGQAKEGVNIAVYPDPLTGVVANEARTQADGTYCLNTYSECDGIAPGKYKVTFKLVPKQGRNDNVSAADDQLKGKFTDPSRSTFKLEVKEGSPISDANFDLKTK